MKKRISGINAGTSTEINSYAAPIGANAKDEYFFVRYKFNTDPDDDYRVIPVNLNTLETREITYGTLLKVLEKDNVLVSSVYDVRCSVSGFDNQTCGWTHIGENWKYELDEQYSRDLTLWLLTKKGFEVMFGVGYSAM